MAITRITFKRDGGEDLVLDYSAKWGQGGNPKTGQPTGEPFLEHLIVQILRDAEQDNNFYLSWQLDPAKKGNGDLCFYENTRLVRSWKIKNCFLLNYHQQYIMDAENGGQIKETLWFSPLELDIDGVTFKRKKAA